MRVAVLLPFLAATQCLELAVIFCVVSLKVSRRPENSAFSLLAFSLGVMIGCELLLQEADSLPHGLFWYRLQFVGIFSSCSLLLSFISLVIGQPLSRRFLLCLYSLSALLSVAAFHPLILHLPPPGTRLTDVDREAPGPLFYAYAFLPLAGTVFAGFLGLRGLKSRRERADADVDFRPLLRHVEWIVGGLLLIVLASLIEMLQLVLIPEDGNDLPVNPRAVAAILFCLITACVLGREVFLSEQRKRRLDTENQARLQAVRDVQHEVRNNLGGIRIPLQLAHLELEQRSHSIRSAGRIADALAAVAELDALVQRMLNAARMEAGLPPQLEPPQPADVRALIQSLCDKKALLLAQEREAHLLRGGFDRALPHYRLYLTASLVHASAPVSADTLARVIDNLLDNAVKYSPRGGDIHIHLQEQGDTLAITISDPGLGIAPEEQARIFDEPFHRGRAAHAIAGTGLGLNLVKRLLEAQGGRIAVRSVPGQGSAFILTLPWSHDEAET